MGAYLVVSNVVQSVVYVLFYPYLPVFGDFSNDYAVLLTLIGLEPAD